MQFNRPKRRRRNFRRGSVLVEVAITVPILFAFFGFLWEFSRAEMIRNSVSTACYEGARQGIIEGGSATSAEDAAQGVLDAVGIRNATITVTPATIIPETESVRINISVPLDDNSFVAPFFFDNLLIRSEITLNR